MCVCSVIVNTTDNPIAVLAIEFIALFARNVSEKLERNEEHDKMKTH